MIMQRKETTIVYTLYYSIIVLALALAVLFEADVLTVGEMAVDRQVEFVVAALMELVTLATIPVALRMFKFGFVTRRLSVETSRSLFCFNLLRVLLLGLPLLANTLFYYVFMATPFGYMAIIILISMAFVSPLTRIETNNSEKNEEEGGTEG